MAFTEQNKADAYLFFVLAFNAAPGTVYGGQIVEAYESGMTTAEIVAEYTTKEQFLKLYPATQTNAEFAASLVSNVASLTTSATVKSAAEADIVSALAAGWSKAQVITQILGNLANKTVADAEWGATVAQLNNKIEVAKVLTEGAKALNTTDVALLQNPLSGVTEAVSTVQAAINGAGSLTSKLEALSVANKAVTTFAAGLDLNGDGTVDGLDATSVSSAITNDVNSKALLVEAKVSGWTAATTEAQKTALVAAAKANNDAIVAAKQADLAAKNKAVTDLKVTAVQVNQYKALDANVEATVKADLAAKAAQAGALAELNNSTVVVGTSVVNGNGSVDDYIVLANGKLSLDASSGTKVTEANKAVVTALLNSIVAAQVADANKTAAATAKTQFEASLDSVDSTTNGAEKNAVDALIAAEKAVTTAQKANTDLDKLLANYASAKANDTSLTALNAAITAAKKAFTDAGLPEPQEIANGLGTSAGDDSFIIGAAKTGTIAGFGALGKDSIFVGSGYELNATGDLAKGDATKLEVFFKANGASTDVYVEQKAFDSNATGTPDIVKITLTGVTADKLVLKDGFVTVAA